MSTANPNKETAKKKRVLLLHGFGDDERSFEVLAPLLESTLEPKYVDYYTLCDDLPLGQVTAASYAERIIEKHNITTDDILLGHSMGGYIAHAIRQQIEVPVISIGSFTQPQKVRYPFMQFWLIRVAIFLGFFSKWLLVIGGWLKYRNAEGKVEATISAEVLSAQTRHTLYRLLRTFFIDPPAAGPPPQLAFHGIKDDVVAPPDYLHLALAGNHFIHRTRAILIARHILLWHAGEVLYDSLYPIGNTGQLTEQT